MNSEQRAPGTPQWMAEVLRGAASQIEMLGKVSYVEHLRSIATYMEARALEQPASADRDAYEGAREDLLEWKGRAQRAEARLRALGWKGEDASEQPASATGVEGMVPPECVPEFPIKNFRLYAKGWNDCRAAMLAAAPKPGEG